MRLGSSGRPELEPVTAHRTTVVTTCDKKPYPTEWTARVALRAVGRIYTAQGLSDVGGARQPMADDYFGLVERLIRPVTDDYRERAEDNMRKQQERRLTPAPSASTPP